MFKKKNVVEKFKRFNEKLSAEEQVELYDILSMIRGPDAQNRVESDDLKYAITGRIRHILGFNILVGVLNGSEFPPYRKIRRYLDDVQYDHYVGHAMFAIQKLEKLGIIKE